MKKLLIGLLALGSISSFAVDYSEVHFKCTISGDSQNLKEIARVPFEKNLSFDIRAIQEAYKPEFYRMKLSDTLNVIEEEEILISRKECRRIKGKCLKKGRSRYKKVITEKVVGHNLFNLKGIRYIDPAGYPRTDYYIQLEGLTAKKTEDLIGMMKEDFNTQLPYGLSIKNHKKREHRSTEYQIVFDPNDNEGSVYRIKFSCTSMNEDLVHKLSYIDFELE
jgi:hypothetical protein